MKKVVLIVGGSSGIGLASAKLFSEKGYTVYSGSRRYVSEQGIISLTVDVVNPNTLRQAVEFIVEREGRLDILVYSAGFSMAAPVEYARESDYRYLFDVNYFGVITAVQAALPVMKRQGGGRIVNISSVGGVLPIAFDAFYSGSKAALDMLAKGLRMELAPYNVLVTNVLPGGTRTPFTAERKVYSPQQAGCYADSMAQAADSLAKMEQGGMTPEEVAETVYRAATMPDPPVQLASGLTNKLYHLASRLMPTKPALYFLKKKYNIGNQNPAYHS